MSSAMKVSAGRHSPGNNVANVRPGDNPCYKLGAHGYSGRTVVYVSPAEQNHQALRTSKVVARLRLRQEERAQLLESEKKVKTGGCMPKIIKAETAPEEHTWSFGRLISMLPWHM